MADITYVVPTRNEEDYLPDCLDSILQQDTDHEIEIVVVDARSTDDTRDIARSYGAQLVDDTHGTRAMGRNIGAEAADGEWLAFVDADTTVMAHHADSMIQFIRDNDLIAGASRVDMDSPRALPMEFAINHVLSRLPKPILPGFNTVIRADDFHGVGGFPDVPNEDTAFSKKIAQHGETAYHPDVLVQTSARRVHDMGLTGTLFYYLGLDVQRIYRT